MLFWNCCGGLRSKLDTVKLILDSKRPDLFFISEAEVKSQHPLNLLKMEGYNLITSEVITHGKSRLVLYVKDGLKFQLKTVKNTTMEVICVDINNTRIIGCYRPFKTLNGSIIKSLEELIEELESLKDARKTMIIGGDFNINPQNKTPESIKMNNFVDKHGLSQLIKQTTWRRIITINGKQTLKKSCIDHVYTDDASKMKVVVGDQWSSDHNIIELYIKYTNRLSVTREKHHARNWKTYNATKAANLASSLNMINSATLDTDDVNDLNYNIGKILTTVQEELCSIRVIRTSRTTDIISNNIEALKKKRKRKLRDYNISKDDNLLRTINILNKDIKKAIKEERKHIIQTKIQSGNAKSFWNQISKLEGKSQHNGSPSIKSGVSLISNHAEVSELFANFFTDKVSRLSGEEEAYSWVRSEEHIIFEDEEVLKEVISMKGKMSSGEDGIMMKVLKDASRGIIPTITKLFNLSSKSGMPNSWRLAKVTPLHKKGPKDDQANYRPISNLQSLSKLYEKAILRKLDKEFPNLEGDHQHGFRSGRSTTSAVLELQSLVSNALDKGSVVATYSIDMSAAFDLLRPRLFHTQVNLPPKFMNLLIDFMTGRVFSVSVGNEMSSPKNLNVGCVQGSVLGPKLFSLYCAALPSVLPPYSHVISYADDSYVSIIAEKTEDIKQKVTDSLQIHQDYMASIGMVINASKTELVIFSRGGLETLELDSGIKLSKTMKVLGLTVSSDLSWDEHVNTIVSRTAYTIRMIKHLRRWLTTEDCLRIVTSKYFGLAYYGSPVWMTPCLGHQSWKRLFSQHYRAIRAAVGDWRTKIPRAVLDIIGKRANPRQWAQYSVANYTIKAYNKGTTPLGRKLKQLGYINDRCPKRAKFFDTSRLKIGRQDLLNRLNFLDLSFDWIGNFSDDYLRTRLKKEFFIS